MGAMDSSDGAPEERARDHSKYVRPGPDGKLAYVPLDDAGNGIFESWGRKLEPRSLYEKQLEDRLGPEAVRNIRDRIDWSGLR
jgi:hypothetical protein